MKCSLDDTCMIVSARSYQGRKNVRKRPRDEQLSEQRVSPPIERGRHGRGDAPESARCRGHSPL